MVVVSGVSLSGGGIEDAEAAHIHRLPAWHSVCSGWARVDLHGASASGDRDDRLHVDFGNRACGNGEKRDEVTIRKPSRRALLWGVWINVALTAVLLIADFYFHIWS